MKFAFCFGHETSKPRFILPLVAGSLLCLAGCGGESGTGGTATSSSGTGGSSPTTTSSGAGGSVACKDGVVHLQGMLDGAIVSGDFKKGDIGPSSLISVNFGSGGMLRVNGDRGTLRMPDDGPEPGVWFATGAGTKSTDANGSSGFTLAGLKRLGTCAKATGTGDLAFCDDSNGSCPGGVSPAATGKVNGKAFDWGGHPNFEFLDFADESLSVRWKSGAALFGLAGAGKITSAILWMPTGAPDSDAYWCSTSGTYSEMFGGPKHIDVTGLKRLGTAPEGQAVTGQIDGCY